jgi:hypothetical protein
LVLATIWLVMAYGFKDRLGRRADCIVTSRRAFYAFGNADRLDLGAVRRSCSGGTERISNSYCPAKNGLSAADVY